MASLTFEDRIWIDHFPKNAQDKLQALYAVSEEEFGVYLSQSDFEGDFSIFAITSELTQNDVEILMLQTDKKHVLKYTLSDKNVPHDFDFSLTMKDDSKHPRGPKVYYSMEGWEIDGNNKQEKSNTCAKMLKQIMKLA